MTDLDAMLPCPVGKRGEHHLAAVLPESSDLDMTLFCEACGAVRRLPVSGALLADRLDDLTADEIEARLYGGRG